MHHLFFSIVALLGLFVAPTLAAAQDLVLKRVMLSSGGLGYFEYEATVDGDATLKLTVSLPQVDDVLKSLVVYDDKGGVGGLSLPGREPLAQAFKDLPFDQDALGSPADLLATLKGAEITVGGSRAITGRIVSVQDETVTTNDGKATTKRTRITLLTDRGLQQFILEDAENLQFTDAALRDKVAQALLAIQTNRAKDARTLELSARGQGKRTVRVAYIVEVPPNPAGRSRGAARGFAGLGDGRESERPRLEGHRAHPGIGPSRGVPPGALRGLLRQASRDSRRGRRAADARRRPRRRGGRQDGATTTAGARRGTAVPAAAGTRSGRDSRSAACRRRRRPGRGDRCRDPGRLQGSARRERRQWPYALDPDHRPPGARRAVGALSGRDGGAQSAGRHPSHQRRR
jgi:hypothetical protein